MRSIYHIREYNVRRLSLLSSPDVFLSHDWPCGIEQHGDLNDLLRRKPFFRDDIMSNKLGSPPLMVLLRNLQPTWWFAAHLHTRFEARVRHDPPLETTTTLSPSSPSSGPPPRAGNPDEITIDDNEEEDVEGLVEDSGFDAPSGGSTIPRVAASIAPPPPQNPDEITLDDEIEMVEPPLPPPPPPRETTFLALDKCLPRRQFLEVVDIPTPTQEQEGGSGGERQRDAVVLSYDPEWLAITRAFQPYLSLQSQQATYPNPDDARAAVSREWDWVHAHVPPKLNLGGGNDNGGDRWCVDACQRFARGPPAGNGNSAAALAQTEAFAALLEMENVVR
jgi:lariat debranching enzyme